MTFIRRRWCGDAQLTACMACMVLPVRRRQNLRRARRSVTLSNLSGEFRSHTVTHGTYSAFCALSVTSRGHLCVVCAISLTMAGQESLVFHSHSEMSDPANVVREGHAVPDASLDGARPAHDTTQQQRRAAEALPVHDAPPQFTAADLHSRLVQQWNQELLSIGLNLSNFPGIVVNLFDCCDAAMDLVRIRHPVRPVSSLHSETCLLPDRSCHPALGLSSLVIRIRSCYRCFPALCRSRQVLTSFMAPSTSFLQHAVCVCSSL